MGFDFEKLEVWEKAVDYSKDIISLVANIETERKHYRLIEQLEASSASIAANIAEGKGRYSKKEFVQFLHIAKGSLYEVITFLTIFYSLNWIKESQLDNLKQKGEVIGKMLSKLIASIKQSM